jgi:hypothetical protein
MMPMPAWRRFVLDASDTIDPVTHCQNGCPPYIQGVHSYVRGEGAAPSAMVRGLVR